MTVSTPHEDVFFKSVTCLVADRDSTSDLLFIKRLNLALLFERIEIKYLDDAVWTINKKKLAAAILDVQLGDDKTDMLGHVVMKLHLNLLAEVFAFVTHD
jgi:hypothetical protein